MQRDIRWTSDSVNETPDERDGTTSRRPRLLLVCDYRPDEAAAVLDHIEGFRRWSRNDVYVLPMHGDFPADLDLTAFDGLLIHYNVVMIAEAYLSPLARWRVREYRGPKAAFIQDEYRFVDSTVSVMRTLGINVLFTCVPGNQVSLMYPAEALPELKRTVTVLTGYVPDALLSVPHRPFADRPLDVAYRGRRLPPWLGALARDKATIADRFAEDAQAYGLRTDISNEEQDRIYGQEWIDFLRGAKATLGAETGANVIDFDGSIEAAVRAAMAADPGISFEELHRRFLADVDGRIRLNQISPRSFEAAALGTLMVLYPGEYSGILQPWKHYIPLEKDHSNMDEVVRAIRDRETWERITSQARQEVACNPKYSFRGLLELVDEGLDLHDTAVAPLDPASFEELAFRNLDSMLRARLRPGGWRRIMRVTRRIGHHLTPSPIAIRTAQLGGRARWHVLREVSRYARAFLYWAVRPRTLPWRLVITHRGPLLRDLSDLARLADFSRRATSTGAGRPFTARLDLAAGEVRIVISEGRYGDEVPGWPTDLAGVADVYLDLNDVWLVPPGVGAADARRLDGLSAVVRARPDVGRRLLAGAEPWCEVRVTGPDAR